MTEPILIKAGSDRLKLGLNEQPPSVDCRVVEENNYQALKRAFDLHVVIASAEFTKAIEKAIEDGEDFSYNAEGGYEYFNQITAVENVLKVIKEHLL